MSVQGICHCGFRPGGYNNWFDLDAHMIVDLTVQMSVNMTVHIPVLYIRAVLFVSEGEFAPIIVS